MKQQRGGNPALVQDLYKLAIPFGMLFAQQGVRSAIQPSKKYRSNKSNKSDKSAKSSKPAKPTQTKSVPQKGGNCGCNSQKIPYAAFGGSLQSALDHYLDAGKHV